MLTVDDEWTGSGIQSEDGLMLLSFPKKLDVLNSEG